MMMIIRERRRRQRRSGAIFRFLIIQFSVLLLLLCATSSSEARRRGQANAETAWKEILPDTQNDNQGGTDFSSSSSSSSSKRRLLIWCGSINEIANGNLFQWWRRNKKNQNEEQVLEHPLRTDLYELNVSWMGFKERFRKSYPKTIQIEFHPNGFCRLNDGTSSSSISDIGTWKVFPWGLWFNIHHDGFDYTFNAAVHLNPFGKHPKLMQGTIIKCRNTIGHQDDDEQDEVFVKASKVKWFRPVVGKFSGIGIGTDSIDLSYANRR